MIKKILTTLFGLALGLALLGVGLLASAILIAYPKLPSLENIKDYKPKMPLTVYSADGELIGIYGEERREFTKITEFKKNKYLINAVIAAEDKRFYEHWGVDVIGVARAAIGNIRGGGVQSGASTITQQVARNFYLTNERTLTRKFHEALLAYKIEHELTKDQILELYFNQIYLGQRAYGFTAAAKIYFNKPVQEITLAEATILAGLPKAPSAYNPVVNPKRAKQRQEYILNNMVELGMISSQEKNQALQETPTLEYGRHMEKVSQDALYIAEMVRQELYNKYGEDTYTSGFKVYTTVSLKDQRVANNALRTTLKQYGMGAYRGAEDYIDLSAITEDEELVEVAANHLAGLYEVDSMIPAVVLSASKKNGITVQLPESEQAKLSIAQMGGAAANTILNKKLGDAQIRKGAVIRLKKTKNGFKIAHEPILQGALVSLDSKTGAIRALVGGYDFHSKTFNRATQAMRQPGSSFKPFVYSAALAKGMTAATLINDAPLSIPGAGAKGQAWEPKNADGRYAGYITMRQGLTQSRNIVSIRLLMASGMKFTQNHLRNFGFSEKDQPANLSMALGSGAATPLQMAQGYAVFANGGYKVNAYVIDKIYDSRGNLIIQTNPITAGQGKPAIDPRNAYIMYSMMQDVVTDGTARAALSLNRKDIAGKTGTTNDTKDAWFVGFNPDIVTAVYIGYDTPRSMGKIGYGGKIALPVWNAYMKHALKGLPDKGMKVPAGMVKRGGEYFIKGQTTDSPSVALDNSSSREIAKEERTAELARKQDSETANATSSANDSNMMAGEVPLEPTNRKNSSSSRQTPTHSNSDQITDNLF